ncbi:hypothetical protein [Corallococcus exercitus]|uniref:Uncharacterized protein n=1 Tax=Corallococcus exercitus TaxID=2316736 RepID=A0A7Y4KHE9_9BACT|nr:hypothetical protein [Corallococcus exercitus]NOK32984.1 hypothetical protein [Corallococcus exercitus]
MRLTATIKSLAMKSMGQIAVSLEITSADGAFYLFRLGANEQPLGDTWHQSLDEAMRQAKTEFSVGPDDWTQVEP